MNDNIPNEAAGAFFGGEAAQASEQERNDLELLLPGTGEYAGWVYHYAMDGSINVSTNLLPGSASLDESCLYPFEGDAQELRDTVLTEP